MCSFSSSLTFFLKPGCDGWKSRSHPARRRTVDAPYERWPGKLEEARPPMTLWNLVASLKLLTFDFFVCGEYIYIICLTILNLFSVT